MADVFSEVDEQLRSARLQSFLMRAWPFALAAAVAALLIAVAVWAFNKHEQDREAAASVEYGSALDALQAGDKAGAAQKFAALAASAPPGYRALSLMQEAGLTSTRGKPAEAIRMLDEAAKAAPDPDLADAAKLKAALMVMDHGSTADAQGRLTALIGERHPYAALAREALAMSRLQAGKTAQAREDFSVLSLLPDTSQIARARAQAAMGLIDDGVAADLPAVLKAAAALPPAAAPTRALPIGAVR